MAPATPTRDAESPRYMKPRNTISSVSGAATTSAIAKSQSVPESRAVL